VSLANMARLDLPPAITTVILCADNDTGNDQTAGLVQRAADRFAAEGRAVRIARAPAGKDFNDTLRAGDRIGAAGGGAAA
jgi:DNA primase